MTRLLHVALVTAAAARELDEDLAPLAAALQALPGLRASIVDWDDAATDWAQFDLAVLRSTWDYSLRIGEFLDWATRAAQQTQLLNPLAVVRWNTDKHYLHELAGAGVRTVASSFVEPGDDGAAALAALVAHGAAGEFVVKPAVGAGSRDAQRYGPADAPAALGHVRRLQEARRSVVLQPYLARVDTAGETALVFFEGRFSHAIRKGPLLRRGDAATRALFAAEHITPRVPDADERALAEATLAAMPFAQPLAYARVDLIRDDDGRPCVLELELTEPSLFFDHAPGSAARFAGALAARARAPAQR